jgi:hypothetical protein
MAVTVTVSPASVSLPPNGSEAFTCTVSGSTNDACTWRVTEAGGGAINAQGMYTAPGTGGTYHVTATSVADPASTGTATVTVVAQVVGSCNALPAAGTWENITPPSLNIAEWCEPYSAGCPNPGVSANGKIGTYGTHAFVLDPNHSGTVYLGTAQLGMWKSTDCGSTWAHVNTGQNGAVLDAGRQWTIVIDPTDSDVLYTVAGYGQGGVFKSTNAGVDWTQILPKNILSITSMGFVEKITMDPTDNRHLVVGFHTDCTGTPLPGTPRDATGGWGCLAESTDAGTTWSLTTGPIPWSGLDGPGQTMIDAKTWFYGSNGTQGLWRTTTGGVSVGGQPAWTEVYSGASTNGSVYVAKSGTYYSGGSNVIWSSNLGVTWTAIPNSPATTSINGSTMMVDDGQELYVGSVSATYWTTPDGSPSGPFTMISSTPSKPLSAAAAELSAGYLDYDSAHHLLYSSNLDTGFWRFVTQ